MSEQTTLIKFGHKFQTKIISSLLGEKVFLQTICDILEPEYFDSDSNKWISQTIRDYFFEYKTAPTLEVMKVKIDEIENDDIVKIAECIGGELVRAQEFNMDKEGPMGLMSFIGEALKSASPDAEEWWK